MKDRTPEVAGKVAEMREVCLTRLLDQALGVGEWDWRDVKAKGSMREAKEHSSMGFNGWNLLHDDSRWILWEGRIIGMVKISVLQNGEQIKVRSQVMAIKEAP
jgi:hypothetical protein